MAVNPEEHIEQMVGKDTGFKVPEGYFENLYASMPSKLPERETPATVEMTRWQKLKPYVYLAAMFAGIWCMMQVFHLMSPDRISLDNPPKEIMAAIYEAPETFDEYVPDYAASDFELESAISQEYKTFDELVENLDCELEPEYANMDVEVEATETKTPVNAKKRKRSNS